MSVIPKGARKKTLEFLAGAFFPQNKKKCLKCSETKEYAKYFLTFLQGYPLKTRMQVFLTCSLRDA